MENLRNLAICNLILVVFVTQQLGSPAREQIPIPCTFFRISMHVNIQNLLQSNLVLLHKCIYIYWHLPCNVFFALDACCHLFTIKPQIAHRGRANGQKLFLHIPSTRTRSSL